MPHGKANFWGVWPIENHCKTYDLWSWVKDELCGWTDFNDLYIHVIR